LGVMGLGGRGVGAREEPQGTARVRGAELAAGPEKAACGERGWGRDGE
jgi:hypothetical protein